MAQKEKENSGVLFRNNKKETEKHPDYTGKCLVNGKVMFISSWINESANGTKYMALKFQEPKAENVSAAVSEESDDLPW